MSEHRTRQRTREVTRSPTRLEKFHEKNFTIDSTGQLKTKVGANFNYEAGDESDRVQPVRIKVTDPSGTVVKNIIVEVTDVDEPPNKPTGVERHRRQARRA